MRKILLLFFCLICISAYSQGIKLNGPVSAENNPITNVADPTEDQDAATKSYVDSNVNNSSTNSLLAQINANIQIVDGRIVAVDGKLDNVLVNLSGQQVDLEAIDAQNAEILQQLASMLTVNQNGFTGVNANFTNVNGELDNIDTTLASNQSEALIWYLNTMTGIGRTEVDLEAIGAQNAAILTQLAAMLTVINNGFVNQSAELTAAQTAIISEITNAQMGITNNLLEISNIQITQSTILSTLNSLQTSIQALQADVTILLGD